MYFELSIAVFTLLLLWLAKIWRQQRHWQHLGVAVAPGLSFPLGNNPFFLSRKVGVHAGEVALDQYQWAQEDPIASKMGFYGVYTLGTRALIVTDVEMVTFI